VVASNERLTQEFGRGFDAVNGTLEMGFGRLESALGGVEASIESLHSDFNYNMGLVLDQLQIQNQLTFGILERLDAIHKTLEHPELTKAREFYNRGCDRLSKGLLDKALEAFLNAEETNDTDFFIQFQIGKLYLYGIDEDDNVINLPKAEEHLRDAARYGKAEIAVMPEFKRWTGEALLHTSITCYAQANDRRVNGDSAGAKEFISKAFQLAQQACEIYPSLYESQYHLAKYAALLGDVETSVQSLEKAVTSDVSYCLKTEFDRDFNKMRQRVFDLFEQLRAKMGEKARSRLRECKQNYIIDMVYLTDEAKKGEEKISNLLSNAEIEISKDTILDIHGALQTIDQIEPIFSRVYNTFVEKYSIDNFWSYAISPDGKLVADVEKFGDLNIEVRRITDGKILYTLPAPPLSSSNTTSAIESFSPNGNLIVTRNDENIKLWRVGDGELIHTLPVRLKRNGLSFSPDGKLVATIGKDNIKLWRVSDGKLIHTLPENFVIEFTPDGKLIAAGGYKTTKLRQVGDGKLLHTLSETFCGPFSPDGKLIATWDESVKLWQVSDGKLIHTLPAKYHPIFSPDSKLIAAGDGETVKLFQVSDGKLIQTLPGEYASFSPDGTLIVTGDRETVKLWRVSDGKLIQTLPEKKFISFSQEVDFVITSNSGDPDSLKIWGRQVIPKKEFDQHKRLEEIEKVEIEKRNKERQNLEGQQMQNAQEYIRRVDGLCSICGAKLSFWDKLRGRITCSKHSS
jgi:WD40 repeat protein